METRESENVLQSILETALDYKVRADQDNQGSERHARPYRLVAHISPCDSHAGAQIPQAGGHTRQANLCLVFSEKRTTRCPVPLSPCDRCLPFVCFALMYSLLFCLFSPRKRRNGKKSAWLDSRTSTASTTRPSCTARRRSTPSSRRRGRRKGRGWARLWSRAGRRKSKSEVKGRKRETKERGRRMRERRRSRGSTTLIRVPSLELDRGWRASLGCPFGLPWRRRPRLRRENVVLPALSLPLQNLIFWGEGRDASFLFVFCVARRSGMPYFSLFPSLSLTKLRCGKDRHINAQ